MLEIEITNPQVGHLTGFFFIGFLVVFFLHGDPYIGCAVNSAKTNSARPTRPGNFSNILTSEYIEISNTSVF